MMSRLIMIVCVSMFKQIIRMDDWLVAQPFPAKMLTHTHAQPLTMLLSLHNQASDGGGGGGRMTITNSTHDKTRPWKDHYLGLALLRLPLPFEDIAERQKDPFWLDSHPWEWRISILKANGFSSSPSRPQVIESLRLSNSIISLAIGREGWLVGIGAAIIIRLRGKCGIDREGWLWRRWSQVVRRIRVERASPRKKWHHFSLAPLDPYCCVPIVDQSIN